MRVKFSNKSTEEMCGDLVPDSEKLYKGGFACSRTAGHAPPCIAMARDAAKADGVCHWCRLPMPGEHLPDCGAAPEDDEDQDK